jgi:hypothetical protein
VQLSDALIINDHIVNETRFQYRHESSSQTPASTAPAFSVSQQFTGGGSTSQVSKDSSDNFELQNLTTMSLGAHALKFGTRLRDGRDDNSTNANFNGSFSFVSYDAYTAANTALTNFGTNGFVSGLDSDAMPQTLNYTTGPQDATANVFDAALFVQDDWKVNKMLTLSGGLRWESQNHVSDHSDWAPRVALAYALDGHKTGKSKTVLRAGYGLFYDRFSLSDKLSLVRNAGDANSQTQHTITSPVCFASTYIAGLSSDELANCISSSSATSANTSTIKKVASNYRSPYTQQFGAGLERQLTKGTTVTATYLHSFGVHQMATINANPYKQGTYVFGSTTLTGERIDPTQGIVEEYYPEAVFKQDQLILNVNTKLSSNLSVMGFYNYT